MATVKSNGVEDYIDAIHLFRHGVDVLFFLVNATYICLIWELIDRAPVDGVSPAVRRIMRFRSITTLCLFGVAALVALKYPLAGLWDLYLLPDRLPEARSTGSWAADISKINASAPRGARAI